MINIMRLRSVNLTLGLVDLCHCVNDHFCDEKIDMVEVGSYAGESTAIFLANLRNIQSISCVDMWSKTNKYSVEEISEAEKIFHALHSKNKKVKVFKSHSRDKSLPSGVKFVYIDAAHDYANVKADIDFWLPRVVPGGIIAGHDYSQKFSGVIKAVEESFSGKLCETFKDTSWLIKI